MSSKAIVTKFIVSSHELFKYSMQAGHTFKFNFRQLDHKLPKEATGCTLKLSGNLKGQLLVDSDQKL